MPCYHPIKAWRSIDGKNDGGKWPLVFKEELANTSKPVIIPCGKCIGCRLERSRQWAIRCVHEASMHEENCFVTITYDDEHLNLKCGIEDIQNGKIESYSLNKREFVLFFKRLRKKIWEKYKKKVRFFHCGEYGSQFGRPHHHFALFGFDFPDKQLWSVRGGNKLYVSKLLSEEWGNGYCTIGEVTFESAAYIARYVTKKITGEKAVGYYDGREPEYTTMSRRPGIGYSWYEKYGSDIRNYDKMVLRGGLTLRPPKYYDKIYDKIDPEAMELVKERREKEALKNRISQKRLLVKEKIKRILLKQNLQRIYENGESDDLCS